MTRLATMLMAYMLGIAGYGLPPRAHATPLPAVTLAGRGCADLLERMHRKPAHVVYTGCRYRPDLQGKPLVARYRVRGRFAGAAEAYFVRSVGLDRLRRSCCLWDTPARQFKDKDGREYSITMVSSETRVTTRAGWRRIAAFEITLDMLTEEI